MNMPFTLTALTALSGEDVLPLAQAKEHLRVIDDDEDATITALVDAAASWVERESGLSLVRRNWLYVCDCFPENFIWAIDLPMGPVSIVTVKYLDATTGVQTTMASGDYHLGRNKLEPGLQKSWPSVARLSGAVEITYQAGPTAVPGPLLSAIRLMTEYLYVNRGSAEVDPPAAIRNLIHHYRRMVV